MCLAASRGGGARHGAQQRAEPSGLSALCQEEHEESSEDEEIESSGDDEEGDEDEGAPMDADGQQV